MVPQLRIIIPVLNENSFLPKLCQELENYLPEFDGEIVCSIADGGSRDGSLEWAQAWIQGKDSRWSLCAQQLYEPSVASTIALAFSEPALAILILPADCSLSREALVEVLHALRDRHAWGAFPKQYDPQNIFLRAYGELQNRFRLRRQKHAVWTNALFFEKQFLADMTWPEKGFLEDVQWVDQLRRANFHSAKILNAPVIVSSRRYYPDRVLQRIWTNAWIMLIYRTCGSASPIFHLRLYYRGQLSLFRLFLFLPLALWRSRGTGTSTPSRFPSDASSDRSSEGS